MEFSLLDTCVPAYSFVDIDRIMYVCTAVFHTFQPLSCIIDPFPIKFVMSHLSFIISETALLRVYNDIITTIDRGHGAMLVLHDLSAAFDTIDHDKLFSILG